MCCVRFFFFFFKQKTAYEMRISDWSSDVCSSDLEIAQREDPAGMGVFSLAGRTVTVRSFSRVADEGWAMTIPADAWEGTQPLAVESCRIRAGTEIIIAMPKEWLCNLRAQVEAAARH